MDEIDKKFYIFVYFCYSNEGTCQLYNSTECHEYLAGTYVYIKPPKHLKRLEKQLRRWFKESKRDAFFFNQNYIQVTVLISKKYTLPHTRYLDFSTHL